MSKFLNNRYSSLEAYTPGEQPQDMQYVKLNTNESPYPPAPEVLTALSSSDIADLRLYSDPDCAQLKTALAETYGVEKENIFVSNGSDDILNFAFMAFGENGAAYPDISYGFYPVFAQLHNIDSTVVPLKEDFSINPADYFGLNRLIVIANPNAPTGMTLSLSQVESILASNPDSVVVIDEAYVDFGGTSCVPLTKKYGNLLVVMTYSKSRSMAGARLGFAIGSKALIDDLDLLKYSTNPYNVNRLTLKLGKATLDAADYYREKCAAIIETRAYTTRELEKLGFEVLPSTANFIFAKKDGVDGGYIYEQLKKRGVLIRHFTKERIKDYNRITIGTKEQMDVFLEKLKEII